MNGLKVEAANSPEGSQSSTLCTNKYLKFRQGEIKTIQCNANTFGKYVKLSLPGHNRTLSLCEVEVFGSRGKRFRLRTEITIKVAIFDTLTNIILSHLLLLCRSLHDHMYLSCRI